MTYAIFSPKLFVASRTPINSMIQLVKTLKKHGAKLYVLSNWDAESFALMKEKHKETFDLFDGTIISGECGYVKPQPEIFRYLKKHIDAQVICFLDDQLENINAAQEAGIYTIHVTRKNGYLSSGIDTTLVTRQAMALLKAHSIVSY